MFFLLAAPLLAAIFLKRRSILLDIKFAANIMLLNMFFRSPTYSSILAIDSSTPEFSSSDPFCDSLVLLPASSSKSCLEFIFSRLVACYSFFSLPKILRCSILSLILADIILSKSPKANSYSNYSALSLALSGSSISI